MNCNKCGKDIADASLYCSWCGARQAAAPVHHRRCNGLGSAYKRADRAGWTAQVTLGSRLNASGKVQYVYHRKSGFRTKKEALEYVAAYNGSREKKCPALLQCWEQYESAGYTQLSNDKRTAYRIAWKRWKKLEFCKIQDITTADLQEQINSQVSTYYPAKDMRDLMSHFFKQAEIDGFVARNLAKYIVLPPKTEVIPNPFTREEQEKLWEDYAAGNWWTGYILLMIYTSMMPGEVMGCRKECVNLENHTIVGAGKKTAVRKNTAIVLADIIIPVVQCLMENTPGDKLIRINKDRFYKNFHVTIDRLQLRKDLTPYSCRHTTATALVAADIQPSVIQAVMRHAKFSSTQRYIHVTNDAALSAVNKL